MKNMWRYSVILNKALLAVVVALSMTLQPVQAWAAPSTLFSQEQEIGAESSDAISESLESSQSPEEVATDEDFPKSLSGAFPSVEPLGEGIAPVVLYEVFQSDITVGGTVVACTFKVTSESGSNRTVQVGDGTSAAISTASVGDIVMPGTVTNGATGLTYAVTSYGNFAFRACGGITSTGLASNTTVVSVGASAFEGCVSLASTSLESNATVTKLGNNAFSGCSGLVSTGLAVNTKLTSFGSYVFQNCTTLTSTGFEANQTITAIPDYTFTGCSGLVSTGLSTNAKVTAIGANAFKDCTALAVTGLETNNTVTTLGSSVFSRCTNLMSTGLSTNAKVTTLGSTVFEGCIKLTSTGFESNTTLKSVSNGMFTGCTSLASTGLESNAAVTTIGASAFANCAGLIGDLVIVSRITTIGASAFWNTKYTRIYLLQDTLPSVGTGAFAFMGTQPVLYVPSTWEEGEAVTVGSRNFSTAGSTLVYMRPPSITEAFATRLASDAVHITFTLGAKGDVVVSADGVSVSDSFEAGQHTVALSDVGVLQTLAILEATAFYGPVKTWYNTTHPPSQISVLTPAYAAYVYIEYYFDGVHDPDRGTFITPCLADYVCVADVILSVTPSGYRLVDVVFPAASPDFMFANVSATADLTQTVSALDLDNMTVKVFYESLPYQMLAQDFRYAKQAGHLSAAEAMSLANMTVFDSAGNPVDGSQITVDAGQLAAINAALAAEETGGGSFPLSFYAPDGTKAVIEVMLYNNGSGQDDLYGLPTGPGKTPSTMPQTGDSTASPILIVFAAGALVVLWVYRWRREKRD